MILADTSAWVEYDRAAGSVVDRRLTELIADEDPLAVTEPVVRRRCWPGPAAVAWRCGTTLLARRYARSVTGAREEAMPVSVVEVTTCGDGGTLSPATRMGPPLQGPPRSRGSRLG